MVSRSVGVLLLVLAGRTACADVIYTLNQPILFESSPYGFSGTITTDGSIGILTTLDFIESWSITVFTPATVDGVSSELLEPTNSMVSLFISDTPGLIVTSESISLSPGPLPLATLSWSTLVNDTRLEFSNRVGTGGGVTVSDPSEPDWALGVTAGGAPIASNGILVPEPLTSALLSLGAVSLCLATRRLKRRMHIA